MRFVAISALLLFWLGAAPRAQGLDWPVPREWRALTLDGFGEPTEEGFWWITSVSEDDDDDDVGDDDDDGDDDDGRSNQDDSRLFINSWNSVKGGAVHRSDLDGEYFERISPYGLGNRENWSLLGLEFFRGCLYTSTWNSAEGGEMWRSCDAFAPEPLWEVVVDEDDFGEPVPLTAGTHIVTYKGSLHTGTFDPPRNFSSRSGDPFTWQQVGQENYGVEDGLSDSSVGYVFKGKYFIGTENQPLDGNRDDLERGNMIFVLVDGEWEVAAPPGFGTVTNVATLAFIDYREWLYVTTWHPGGGQVWRTRAKGQPPYDWEPITLNGFGMRSAWMPWATAKIDGELYIGGWGTYRTDPRVDSDFGRGKTIISTSAGFLMKSSDGVIFEKVPAPAGGWGDFPQIGISHMTVFRDKLYVLTQSFGYPGQVWVYEPARGGTTNRVFPFSRVQTDR